MTIAGSDSSGGAGIQADLKTISVLGAYGASVITALTAQNTRTVAGIHAPPASFVSLQLETVLSDLDVKAAKTGMLFSASIIQAVASFLKGKSFKLVVDPVCVAQSGGRLLESNAVEALVELIFPHADLLTPNIPETELFTGVSIKGPDDIRKAADILLGMGPAAVLIKGGHMDSVSSTDWFAAKDEKLIPFIQRRIETKNNHGTGCTLSAAIATGLGQGLDMASAIRGAQKYLSLALRTGFDVGTGSGPPNHLAPLFKERGRPDLLAELAGFGRVLASMPGLHLLIPRTGANVALALPSPDGPQDAAAFSGGIVATQRGEVLVAGCPEFGSSAHLSRVIMSAARVNPEIRCVAEIKLDRDVYDAIEAAGLVQAGFERGDEPVHVKNNQGRIMEWGVSDALAKHPEPLLVDVVCDREKVDGVSRGLVLGRDVQDLQRKLSHLVGCLER